MRSSIIIKIFIAFIIVSLVPISGYIAYNDWANHKIVYNLQISRLMNNASQFVRVLDGNIVRGREKIESIRNEIMLCSEYRKEIYKVSESLPEAEHLKRCFATRHPSEQYFILDTKGEVFFSNVEGLSGNNYARRVFFTEAMKGVTYVSEPNMDEGKGYIYYSTPLVNNKKDIYGVLVMRTDAEDIWSLIKEERDYYGKSMNCILTDRYGVRIGHSTDRSLLFRSWVKLDNKIKQELEEEQHYGKDIKEIDSTDIQDVADILRQKDAMFSVPRLEVNNEKNCGYFVPLKEKDWMLGYTIPASTFFIQLNNLTKNSIFSTGIVFIFVVVATWFVSTRLLSPIRRLNHAANLIANGNLEYPITNGQRDEIGKLMESFEIMRNKLKHSYKDLKDANSEAIVMLANACEAKDEDTGNHIIRIRFYVG